MEDGVRDPAILAPREPLYRQRAAAKNDETDAEWFLSKIGSDKMTLVASSSRIVQTSEMVTMQGLMTEYRHGPVAQFYNSHQPWSPS
jgi:hypothetical protein